MEPKTLDFDNLPLVDVTVRYSLRDELPVGLPFAAEVWGKLRETFPRIEDMPFAESPPGLVPEIKAFANLANFRMLTADSSMVAFVQPRVIGISWNATGTSRKTYPRFHDTLYPQLEQLRSTCSEILGRGLHEAVANMRYTVFVADNADLPLSWSTCLAEGFRGRFPADATTMHSYYLNWRGNDNIDKSFALNAATRQMGAEEPSGGFALQTSAGRNISDEKNAAKELIDVHDALIDLFQNILSPEAKKIWELR